LNQIQEISNGENFRLFDLNDERQGEGGTLTLITLFIHFSVVRSQVEKLNNFVSRIVWDVFHSAQA
jgi:hypothetical protein